MDAAVTQGCIAMSMTMRDTLSGEHPCSTCASDGNLFAINAAVRLIFLETTQSPPRKPRTAQLRGEAAPTGAAGENTEQAVPAARCLRRRDLQARPMMFECGPGDPASQGEAILDRRRTDNSLSQSGLIDLRWTHFPKMVDSPLRKLATHSHNSLPRCAKNSAARSSSWAYPEWVTPPSCCRSHGESIVLRRHPIPVVLHVLDRPQPESDHWLNRRAETKYVALRRRLALFIKAACGSLTAWTRPTLIAWGRRRRSDQRVHSGGEPDESCVCRFNEYTPKFPRHAQRCHTPADPVARARDASEEGRERSETLQLPSQKTPSLQVLSQTPFMLSMMIRAVPGPAAECVA